MGSDFRYALRILLKNPAFTIAAIITLALGIGANTAIFSLIDAFLLRPLPVPQPYRLARISTLGPSGHEGGLSIPMFEEFQRDQTVFQNMFAWFGNGVNNVEANGTLFPGDVDQVSGGYYATLGVSPLLGRVISPKDDGSQVAVISYQCWKNRYAGDPAVLGKLIRIEDKFYTIVGVHPKGFTGLMRDDSPDATVPMGSLWSSPAKLRDRNNVFFTVEGRLKDGVTLDQARAQLETLWPAVRAAGVPEKATPVQKSDFLALRLQLDSGATGINFLRQRFTAPLFALMGIAGLVLLLACLNLANLVLARAAARDREIGIRAALGAGVWRVLRLLIAESILISLAGAGVGLAFASWASRLLANFVWIGYVPLTLDLSLDLRVLAFTGAVATATAILFGIAPLWQITRRDPSRILQQNARTIGTGSGQLGKVLVLGQVALSLVLVMAAALFNRSLVNLRFQDLGFQTQHLLVAQLFPKPGEGKRIRDVNYYRQLLAALAEAPGVRSATVAGSRPVASFEWREPVSAVAPRSTTSAIHADEQFVAPRFFETLGIPLLNGHDFDPRAGEHAPRVAILSENLARHLFPRNDAVGQLIHVGGEPENQPIEVIGIAGDADLGKVQNGRAPVVYLSIFQHPDRLLEPAAIVQTSGSPASAARDMRHQIESLGLQYPLRIETADRERDQALLEDRLLAMLSGFFGVLALLLASLGLYGLVSYTVTRRTNEIGIRMALGAQRRSVTLLMVREILVLLLLGVGLGAIGSLAGSRFLSGLLFGLPANDRLTLAAAVGVLLIVGLLSAYFPARRAAGIDPMTAIRHE